MGTEKRMYEPGQNIKEMAKHNNVRNKFKKKKRQEIWVQTTPSERRRHCQKKTPIVSKRKKSPL
jgi:hypothetical protein